MQQNTQSLAKPRLLFPLFPYPVSMSSLHLLVVSRDDGFLAWKVVVGGACRNLGGAGDVPQGSDFEAATAKELQCGAQDQGLGVLDFRHGCQSHGVTVNLNMFKS